MRKAIETFYLFKINFFGSNFPAQNAFPLIFSVLNILVIISNQSIINKFSLLTVIRDWPK